MLLATIIFFLYQRVLLKKSYFTLLYLFLAYSMRNKLYRFLSESDEFIQLTVFRSHQKNVFLLKALGSNFSNTTAFDTDSFALVLDSGASSSAALYKSNFIDGTYKPLSSIIISGIASGLEVAGIGSTLYKIKDDDNNLIDLQIDRILHLKKLPSRLLSP